jgi:hypothetical protein
VVRGPFDRPAYKDWAFWVSLLYLAFLVPGIVRQWRNETGSLVIHVFADVLVFLPLVAVIGIRARIRSRSQRHH